MVKARYDAELISRLRQLLGEHGVRVLGAGGITRSLATAVVAEPAESNEPAWVDSLDDAEMMMAADDD
jgi:hypothetical protein